MCSFCMDKTNVRLKPIKLLTISEVPQEASGNNSRTGTTTTTYLNLLYKEVNVKKVTAVCLLISHEYNPVILQKFKASFFLNLLQVQV